MNRFGWIIFVLCLITSKQSVAQIQGVEEAVVDTFHIQTNLFNEPGFARIALKLDMRAFAKNKYKDAYQEAELTLEHGVNQVVTKQVRIKARGKSRRKQCMFPPIKLNIKETDLGEQFGDHTKTIKLVTHCKNSLAYEKFILKEFLTYKLYNIISPNSFRVKLLKVDYVDTSPKKKDVETWAFVIEPIDMLAERLGMEEIENDNLSQKYMEPDEMVRLTLFNYMVGNTDFAVQQRHNIKVLKAMSIGNDLGLAIPYDFDASGLVDAIYAVPYEGLGIKSVKQRYYLGACANEIYIAPIIKEFLNKKEALLNEVRTFTYLSLRERQEVEDYLNEFFESAENPESLSRRLMRTCL